MSYGQQGGKLDGGVLLNRIAVKNPELGQLLQDVIDGVNKVATNTATSAIGDVAAPKAPDNVNVSTAGELMHISISHSGQVDRGIRYFSEVSTNSSFSHASTMVIDHGASRTSHPFSLPTMDANGNKLNYYVRSYVQYPGGPASEKYTVGGGSNPTAHTMSGSTQMTLATGHGSGTGSNDGKNGGTGVGCGQFQQRSK